jgi:hypothetical protein
MPESEEGVALVLLLLIAIIERLHEVDRMEKVATTAALNWIKVDRLPAFMQRC